MTRFLSTPRAVLLSALMVASVSQAQSASAQLATAAQTVIRNTAIAKYLSPTDGSATESQSKVVETTVLPVCSVSLLSAGGVGTTTNPAQNLIVLPNELATFNYTLTNASNYQETFELKTSTNSGSGLNPIVKIHLDANGNGVVDASEKAVTSVTLAQAASAKLLVVLDGLGSEGVADLTLTTGCAGAKPIASVDRVVVNAAPDISLSKSFSPAAVRPGEMSTVNLVAVNNSSYDTRQVVLLDDLTQQRANGLEYVAGSAKASGTAVNSQLEFSNDGTTWVKTEPSDVRLLRVTVPKMAPKQDLNLTFKVKGSESADGKAFNNVATISSSGKTTKTTASLEVGYKPAVNLTPKLRPNAPEGSPEDSQDRSTAIVGEEICFEHLLSNTGDVDDVFDIKVAFSELKGNNLANVMLDKQVLAQSDFLIKDKDGKPIALPIAVPKGGNTQVNICYTPKTVGNFDALVTVTGKRGTSNTTRDIIKNVEQGSPVLTKTLIKVVNSSGEEQQDLTKAVEAGSTVTYSISIKNPYSRSLNQVKVTDELDPLLSYVSSSNGGTVSGTQPQIVTWNIPSLAANSEEQLTVTAKISENAKDGSIIKNFFLMTSNEFTTPRKSTTSEVVVFDLGKIVINKEVNPKRTSYGDRLTYTLTIPNNSVVAPIIDAIVSDEPEKGLTYVPSSSSIIVNGQPEARLNDPRIDTTFSTTSNRMSWDVAKINPASSVIIKYQMTVNTKADTQLDNVVQITGTVSGTNARAIASNRAVAQAIIDPLLFAPIADVVGRVFVDRNKSGIFDDSLDTPIERARVIMAGGRIAITDKQGRYNFSNVPYGTQALRLDQSTIPYAPLKVNPDGGLLGTQTVHVRGLTSVNFPLAPLGGDIDAVRRTVMKKGQLTVEKVVYQLAPNEYAVTLKLTTPQELVEFKLNDPLPAKAKLSQGSNTTNNNLPAGESNITYKFTWDGDIREATTDPTASWRY